MSLLNKTESFTPLLSAERFLSVAVRIQHSNCSRFIGFYSNSGRIMYAEKNFYFTFIFRATVVREQMIP